MPVELLQFIGNWSIATVLAMVLFYVIRENRMESQASDRNQQILIDKMVRAVEASTTVVQGIQPALVEIAQSMKDIHRFMVTLDARMEEQTRLMRDMKAQLDRMESGKAKAKVF
jgi:methyl-accepting chemotaxis protein